MNKKITPETKSIILKLRSNGHDVTAIPEILRNDYGTTISRSTVHNIIKKAGGKKLPQRSKEEIANLASVSTKNGDFGSITPKSEEELASGNASICLMQTYILAKSPISRELSTINLTGLDKLQSAQFLPACLMQETVNDFSSSVATKLRNDPCVALICGLKRLPPPRKLSSSAKVIPKEHLIKLQESLRDAYLNPPTSPIVEVYFLKNKDESACDLNGDPSIYYSCYVKDQNTGKLIYSNLEDEYRNVPEVILDINNQLKKSSESKSPTLFFDRGALSNEELCRLHSQDVKFLTNRRAGKKMIEQTKRITEWESYPSKNNIEVHTEEITLSGYKGSLKQLVIKDPDEKQPRFMITNNDKIGVKQILEARAKKWGGNSTNISQDDFYKLDDSAVYFRKICRQLRHNLYCDLRNNIPEFKELTNKQISRKSIDSSVKVTVSSGLISVKVEDNKLRKQLSAIPGFFDVTEIPWMEGMSIQFV